MNKIFIILFILFIQSYECFKLSRYNFIRNNLIHFTLNSKNVLNPIKYNNALIISCNKIGKQVALDLKQLNIKTSVATTKSQKINNLKTLVNEVILIPQIEINNDEIMRNAIYDNDIIIIADTISIFSIHSYVRTCKRITNAFSYKNNKKKLIILISNINVYGFHTDGNVVNELSEINNYNNNYYNKLNENWQINHIAIAKLMRIGENLLLDLMNNNDKIRTVVLRTSTIIDHDWINDIKNRDFTNKNYTKEIGNSYMSISLTEEISNCIKWILLNDNIKGIFNLVSNSYKRRYFYDKLFDIIHKKKINWINDNLNELNIDYYYSMDENPLLPNSQRFNMKVDNSKLINMGYNFKFKNIWNYNF